MNENQHVEWKESWRDEFLKWISGFANAQGGVLVIGKNDRGKVVGVANAAKLLEEIPNKVRDLLGILVQVNLHTKKKLQYLEIVVEPYPYPVSYKGQYFYRSGSTKQELKGYALDKFLLGKQGKRWDGVPVPGVSAKDLDKNAIDRFRERASGSSRLSMKILKDDNNQLLEKLHLYEGDYLKRAALLLFHHDPEKYVTGAYVKIGYFETDSDLRYHDEIHGDLFTQVDGTMDLLLSKYLKAEIRYKGVQREERYPVPEEALREALLNAIAHKDYSSNVPIQISVYDDKILFWNNGQLHEGWTVKNLFAKHSSQPYNPDIANVFFRAGMIESWGRGIEKMIDACKKRGAPQPILRYEDYGLWVEFANKVAAKTSVKTPEEISVKTPDKTSVKTPDEITVKIGDKSSEKTAKKPSSRAEKKTVTKSAGKISGKISVKTPDEISVKTPDEISVKTSVKTSDEISGLILLLMKENPKITIPKVAKKLQKTNRTIELHIRKLKESKQIRRVGPRKGGHWEVLE